MIVRSLGSKQRSRDLARVGRQEIMRAPMPMSGLPGIPSVGQALARVGQAAGLSCPVFPSSMKFLSQTTGSLAMGASETLSFSTPGAFCPYKMFVIGSVDTSDVFLTSIKAGITEQIISGNVPGDLFGLDNDCCPVACLSCLCMPGVNYEVTVLNNDAMAQTVTIVLVGAYRDACPPGMSPEQFMSSLPEVPGCPRPGSDKLLAFNETIQDGLSSELELTTPGKYCPRQLFIGASGEPADIVIDDIRSGLKSQIITGSLPTSLFTTANECCVLACFDCLCAPGYPLFIDLTNNDGANPSTINGVLVGSYEDACP